MSTMTAVSPGDFGKTRIHISLTEFLDFVMTSGSPKLTRVKDAKQRRITDYDPRTDFYKPFRECVHDLHNGCRPRDDMDAMLEDLKDPKKVANYPELAKGFVKFLGDREVSWRPRLRANWSCGELVVNVNPEVFAVIGGTYYIIKLYLKDGKVTKFTASLVNHLLTLSLGPQCPGATFGVLSVRKSRLYEWQEPISGLTSLLEGEATTFARIYREL